jgi:ribose transport system ATP-binding protein
LLARHDDRRAGSRREAGPSRVLEVRGVSKSFGPVRALDRVSLSVERATIHGIVGQNGAGKSTLMQTLVGVYSPDQGEILLDGQPVHIRNPDHARRLGIRIIYQELNLVPYQTVAENIFLGVEPRRFGVLNRTEMERRATRLLSLLGSDLPVRVKVETLNIGQQQLVEIAKALAWEARVLILDEPTAALEMHDMKYLFAVLERFRRQGGTALYVSHRLNELFGICDSVTVLRDGRLIDTLDIQSASRAGIVRMMIGRPLSEVFPPKAREPSLEPVLEVKGLSGALLKDVSFEALHGRILGVVGLEGSGIRELGKVLVGDQSIRRGEIRVDGRPLTLTSPRDALRAGIVYLSSDRKREGLFSILSLAHNVAIGSLDERRNKGLIDVATERDFVKDSISRLSITTPSPGQEVRFLSGGNQQKALLARWLATEPKVFVLDEPTRGIDVGGKAEIYKLMRGLAEAGATVVMINTDLTEALGMSDEVMVLRAGEISARLSGTAPEEEVLSHVVGVAPEAGIT